MTPKEVGILLLGAGVFIVSLVLLHFYITELLPSKPTLSAFCTVKDGEAVLRVMNHSSVYFHEVNAFIGSKACTFDLPPHSSEVCKVEVNGEEPVFRVIARNGRTVKISDVCNAIVYPLD